MATHELSCVSLWHFALRKMELKEAVGAAGEPKCVMDGTVVFSVQSYLELCTLLHSAHHRAKACRLRLTKIFPTWRSVLHHSPTGRIPVLTPLPVELEDQCFACFYVGSLGGKESPGSSLPSRIQLCVLLLGSQPAAACPRGESFTTALLTPAFLWLLLPIHASQCRFSLDHVCSTDIYFKLTSVDCK